jgi:hypothetical protein
MPQGEEYGNTEVDEKEKHQERFRGGEILCAVL